MPDIKASIGSKSYTLACEFGQEDRLKLAASRIDAYAQSLLRQFKTLPEEQMLLMSALMLADDLLEAEEKILQYRQKEGEEFLQPRNKSAQDDDLELVMTNLLKTATLKLKNISHKIKQTG
jgi:cell division protein ZapA (FtsZ GTPase activity inhibitor)